MRRHQTHPFAKAGLLLGSVVLVCCGAESDQGTAVPAESPRQVPGPGIVLTQEQVAHASLQVSAVKAVRKRGVASLPGRVLSIQELAAAQQALARAHADETAAGAQWQAAEAEAKRLQSLFAEGANASQKASQAADAAAEQARAQLNAAKTALTSERAQALQAWGPRLVGELEKGGDLVAAMLALERVPVLVTPGPVGFGPPAEATVQGPDGAHRARFISAVPRTDGVLQGPAWLYDAQSGSAGLPAGLNVEVLLPRGPEAEGVDVPRSAGVWWQGSLWVYLERGGYRYDRVLLSSPQPEADGWFVTSPLRAGDRLVIGGAQILLSEELKAQGVTGETGE